jgi:polyhydroxyalkanoate synthesis regulator phasin
MNLDEINQHLANLVNSGDQGFANAAQFVQQVIQQLDNGQMSGSEAQEVLQDVQRQMEIIQDMSQMAMKETLNAVINGVIVLASAV